MSGIIKTERVVFDLNRLSRIKQAIGTRGINGISANDVCFLLELIYLLREELKGEEIK